MQINLIRIQAMIEWLKNEIFLDLKADSAKRRLVRRGQVYRCDLGCGVGSEMQKNRPAVILQNDIGNIHSGNTIVAPITHDDSKLSCMAPVGLKTAADGRVILDGQVNASNIMCVSKARLGDYICELSSTEMRRIDIAIARTISLIGYYTELQEKLQDKKSILKV